MGHWTVLPFDVACGAPEGVQTIRAGFPVYVGVGIIRRCEMHAPREVDAAEVDAARLRLEADSAQPARVPSGPTYHRPARPLTAFARLRDLDLPFDHRAAAARDDD